MSWTDYDKAARAREIFKRLAGQVVNSMRPEPSYATVESIDRPNRVCYVKYKITDVDAIQVSMASVQPTRPSQVVRIEGVLGDRYVADVLGESYIAGGGKMLGELFDFAGTNVPLWARKAEGQSLSTTEFPDLFQEIGYRHGGAGNVFNLPTMQGSNVNVIKLIRVL